MSYKTTNGLMKHLRKNGIQINGTDEKRKLLNTGYFHGYKGYRFFKNSCIRIPFTKYKEIYATIHYDTELKTLLYGKIMFIETALKNIVLESVLNEAKSEKLSIIIEKIITGYNNAPSGCTVKEKKEFQRNKLKLQSNIQNVIIREYERNNPKITHFYNANNHNGIPIWALFEVLMLGDFGFFLSCLTYDVRNVISKTLGINISADSNRELIYKYVYTLKDLRNAIAHNAVVFDTRFRSMKPSRAMMRCLEIETGLPYVNFKAIDDYVALIVYLLKLLKVPQKEIILFIDEYISTVEKYKKTVGLHVTSIVLRQDYALRMNTLKTYVLS